MRELGMSEIETLLNGFRKFRERPYPVNAGSDRVFFICSL